MLLGNLITHISGGSYGAASGSGKSGTIEMYAGSSYNETISGETLSSLSEKSDTFFAADIENHHRQDFGVRELLCNWRTKHQEFFHSRLRKLRVAVILDL